MPPVAAMLELWRERRRRSLRADRPWHPLSLRFDAPLERAYMRDRVRDFAPMVRLTVLMSIPLYCGYFVLDFLTAQRFVHPSVYVQTFALAIPANIALLVAIGLQRCAHLIGALALLATVVNGVGVANVLVMLDWLGRSPPNEPMMLQLMATLFLMALPFRHAVPLAALLLVIYGGGLYYLGTSRENYFDNVAMLAYFAVLGAVACRFLEVTHRTGWLRALKLRDLSERDSLTGLYNYRIFMERLIEAVAQARRESVPVALVLLDLDYFKQFNDRYGHPAGDEALRRVSAVLDECARGPLDCAARLGGEEFAVMLYGTPPRPAIEKAEELRDRIAQLRIDFLDLGGLRVTASIGVAVADGELVREYDRLVGLADDALYRAKAAGRDCVRV